MLTINLTYWGNGTTIEQIIGPNLVVRIFLIFLTLIIVALGICGNGIVLYSSIKCNVIDMDRVSIILLEHLAVADILVTIIRTLPMLTTLCFNGWVLGSALCFVNGVMGHIPLGFEAILLAMISLHRLYIVTHPKDPTISRLKVKLSLAFVWSFCCVYIAPIVMVDSVVYVIPYKSQCDFTFIKYSYHYRVTRAVMMLILLSTILISNIVMFVIATKQASQITGSSAPRRSAVITISSICLAYLLSYTPFMLCEVLWYRNIQPGWYGMFYSYMLTLNTIVNPIIYTLTNVKFRDHLVRMCRLNNNNVAGQRFRF